jgi:hypothetical protein
MAIDAAVGLGAGEAVKEDEKKAMNSQLLNHWIVNLVQQVTQRENSLIEVLRLPDTWMHRFQTEILLI